MKKETRFITLVICMVMLLSGCSGGKKIDIGTTADTSSTERKTLDTISIALTNEPGTLDPQGNNLIANNNVNNCIFNNLIFKDDNTGEISPCLATGWEQIDELTYNFTLREDVYFHNGEKFTSEDAVYTMYRLATEAATKSLYSEIDEKNTVATGDYSFQLKLKSPWAAVLTYLANPRALVVCKSVVENTDSNFARNPVGTGPYKFVKWDTGDHILIEKNNEYWGEPGIMPTITFRWYPDTGIRAIQLEAGEVDIIVGIGNEDYDRLNKNPNITVVNGASYTHENMYFNQQFKGGSIYDDIRVRKALTYALDIPAMVKAVWGDMAEPADSIYSSALFGHISVGPAKRDVKYAKELLAEAGYPNGIDCEINVPNNSTTLAYLEIAQSMWAEADIRMTINSLDQATMKEINASGRNPFGRSNFTATTGDPIHALAAWAIGYKGCMQANDSYIDDLIKKARAENDDTKRAEYLAEIQRYAIQEKYYAIPVAFPTIAYAYNSKVEGFEFTPTQMPRVEKMAIYAD
jgi:peptide/nickel transport system substrate-binding protein